MKQLEEIVSKAFEAKEPAKKDSDEKKENCSAKIRSVCMSNVVPEEKLKEVQKNTLDVLKDYLSKTYGPMGSYTAIISGTGKDTIQAEYSKDGLKVLKNILFDSPIELSLQSELRDVCQYVEKKVGDGTTSAVIISSLIYSELLAIMNKRCVPPRKMVKEFKSIVEICKNLISSNAKDITLDDIYNICMISTNGNEDVSAQIRTLYKEYGFDVNIDVSISNDQNTKIKEYDGLTINEGYSDPAYINNPVSGTAEIHNASIYAFQDPIDTPEMVSYMEKIIVDNILEPGQSGNFSELVPTVIVAPMLSRDASGLLTKLVTMLYKYNESDMMNRKPPILIITNLSGTDEEIAMDVERLCNCKYIHKYINPDLQKADQEKGLAPTLDTIHEFAGHAELVSADYEKTKFVNPEGLFEISEDGPTNHSSTIYENLVSFLEAEIKNAINQNEDKVKIGRLQKRLKSLKANLVEYLVGGISVSDRDSLRDLVEDAVKNCASAAEYGVGRAANFEGLEAIYKIVSETADEDSLKADICMAIFKAYYEAARILYGTVVDKSNVDEIINNSIKKGCPYNVINLFDGNFELDPEKTNVLCSIKTDIEILDAISKIITMMVTSNQCLLQTPSINRY